MTITKTESGKDITLAVEGRLDTSTAPQMEAEISALEADTKLVLDFTKLEYVSSAGLRVLLGAQKKFAAAGSLTIQHVCEEINEVFEMTGFSDILTIE